MSAQLEQALAFHREGRLVEARALYEDILKAQPDHFDSLHLLGVIALQTKQPQLSVDLIEKAIKLCPNNAAFYSNRGNALQDLKKLDAAVASYDQAIELKPDYVDAYYNRGNVLRELKQLDAALASYNKVIELKPGYAEAYSSRGNILKDLKQLDAAMRSYDKAIELRPDYSEAYSNRGVILQELKQLDAAIANYNMAIQLKSNYAEAYYNLGTALKELKKLDAVVASYDKAIEFRPDYADAYNNRGNAFYELKEFDAALADYERAIQVRPDYVEAYNNLGAALQQLRKFDAAVASYDKAIELNPDYAEAHSNRGNALREMKQLEAAIASYDKAIYLKPSYVEIYNDRGAALQQLRKFDAAVASYDKAIELKPDFAEAYNNRGNALQELKQIDAAIASYDKATQLKPNYAEAYNNRGSALWEAKKFDTALASFDKAIQLKPNYAEAYSNRGAALQQLRKFDAAAASYDKAIELKPDYAEAYNNRGILLHESNQLERSIDCYNKAVEIKIDYAEAYNNRGAAYQALKKSDMAIINYDKAIEIKPDYANAYVNRGIALKELKRLDSALVSFNQAASIKPDQEFLLGNHFHTKMAMCEWQDFQSELNELIVGIENKEKISQPFTVLTYIDSLNIQRNAAEVWVENKCPVNDSLGKIPKRKRNKEKIRIGYFSADFRNHAVPSLTAELFEMHDRHKFEPLAFSFGPNDNGEMRQRLESAFDKFIDCYNLSDKELAQISRDHEVDIAVDLGGFTADSRMGIFSYYPAPIQVSYIGYLGTTGAEYIDYLIADEIIIPMESQQYYSEKIVYLPCYQVNDSKKKVSERIFSRVELGLPKDAFVFCCFNNNFKITPDTFDGWMRILKAVDDAVLFLYADNQWAELNLKKEAERRGVDSKRLIFGGRLARSEYLARYRAADLFLDTLPYNAGTTASDALWIGLPVLTCMGKSFASRMAASLLSAIHLPELITHTQNEYEALAIDLATNPKKFAGIKQRLANNRLTTPLFDTPRFTKNIEAAFIEMYERYQANLPPEHIHIDSTT
jgi:predicted O-linked N-acetylglucosamine transferase (SPINDLY family)